MVEWEENAHVCAGQKVPERERKPFNAVGLDPNHSHFILAANTDEVGLQEAKLRSDFEACVGQGASWSQVQQHILRTLRENELRWSDEAFLKSRLRNDCAILEALTWRRRGFLLVNGSSVKSGAVCLRCIIGSC